ncbi:DUF6273 domain-containing protein [Spirosoma validum]|uniref:DUF6273 domain-containing protein n=1 Tax=Spirosoma validum TaxID=2771355 RepID=A0A927GH56_9BACT|nr:DUF6273 domain-containing protein [Spirosoma validum]MBD2757403.1 hypothetical protein [Spirosoma validum]
MVKHDLITFGQYTWQVLAIEEGQRALIITQDIVDLRWYHHQFVNVTWANSTLRHYLNEELYPSFGPEEQAQIMQVTNRNANNPWFNTAGGPDTADHLFLLSLQEVCQYFGDSQAKLSTKGGQTWLIDDQNNGNRQARYGTDFHGWRLRSDGCQYHQTWPCLCAWQRRLRPAQRRWRCSSSIVVAALEVSLAVVGNAALFYFN